MDSESSSTMEVAALGRPFSLGMLYDCRKDSLIPGMTLWDRDVLMKDVGERPQASNEFEIVASESISDKSSALNVNASLKASFLGGLVQVDGSAKYLNDSKSSRNQARVTLKYKATTKFQELSMNHLGRDNVRHSYVFDKGLATHVVTAILYGAQAFFVFDREVSEHEDHQDVQGNLKVIINKIPLLSVEGEGSLKMEDKDKESVHKFSCRFYGDFCLQKPPTTFQDAIKVYQSLPGLLGEEAVPVKVWLLPLTVLDSSAAKLVRQISTGLVQEAQTVLEDFSELEMRSNDALRTSTAQQFPQIGKKMKTFKEMCSEFKLDFQKSLAKKLPSIRGGGEKEAELAEILKKRHSSPFSSKNLNEWMDCKEREIYTLMSFTRMMKNTKIISSQNDLYKESLSAEHVVCFVFTSLGKDEPYLSALSRYLKGKTNPDLQDLHTHDVEKEQWYASKEVTAEMRRKAKLFSDFAEANKENKNMKFLTVGLTNETQEGSSIHLYKGGFAVSENFEPPSKPETVTAADINHNSVTLKISPPRFGAENITSYSVEYCVSGEDGWQQKTEAKAEEVTVRDLKPNTEYVFRCRAVTSEGVGPANQVSIKTTESLTLKKKVLRVRKQLEALVENLQEQVKLGLRRLKVKKETIKKCKEHEAEISRNENFEFEVTVKKSVQVDISGTGNYSTNCQQCHVTCHYPCPTPKDADKRKCPAMGPDGYCTQCPGKCIWNVHFNQKYRWEYKDIKKKRTMKELKEKYERDTGEKMTVQKVIDKLNAEYKSLQADVVKLMERSAKCLNRLKEIALKPNPLSTLEYIDMLIEEEKSEGKPGWKRRVESLMSMKEKAETK
ncbi:cytolytic toxin-alpha-like [Simochromis diagramma]|uniref:cytolytic toxin-alpha-like n=1 Tax=Simochromis diagramma TaxID=43689 RepID=UPI001A7E7598|nr:cytolytic toxin-alpha-like [Simochromis diagramma]